MEGLFRFLVKGDTSGLQCLPNAYHPDKWTNDGGSYGQTDSKPSNTESPFFHGRFQAGEVRIIEFEDGYSTTGVVEKIAKMVKEGKL